MGAKLVTWEGKKVHMAGRGMVLKSVLTLQAIFHLANNMERVYLWAASRKVSGESAM
jgi:predicted metal-dependent HD superfamily phosphohydrolase